MNFTSRTELSYNFVELSNVQKIDYIVRGKAVSLGFILEMIQCLHFLSANHQDGLINILPFGVLAALRRICLAFVER
jgi:hypothetical protein